MFMFASFFFNFFEISISYLSPFLLHAPCVPCLAEKLWTGTWADSTTGQTALHSMFDDLNPMSSYRVDKHMTWPIPTSCRRQHWFYSPKKPTCFPVLARGSLLCASPQSRAAAASAARHSSLCVHMHSIPGLDKLCCQEIKLHCGKGWEGNSLRQISQRLSTFTRDILALILRSFTPLFSAAAALWKRNEVSILGPEQ